MVYDIYLNVSVTDMMIPVCNYQHPLASSRQYIPRMYSVTKIVCILFLVILMEHGTHTGKGTCHGTLYHLFTYIFKKWLDNFSPSTTNGELYSKTVVKIITGITCNFNFCIGISCSGLNIPGDIINSVGNIFVLSKIYQCLNVLLVRL